MFHLSAVRGYVHPMFPVERGKSEQANIIATEIIRQEKLIFNKNEASGMFTGSVKIPRGCHWKETENHLFILTGDLQSGRGPVLRCHVKEKIWLKIRRESILTLCRRSDKTIF